MNTEKIKTYYKRDLPHIQPIGACFFVTFRLHGSLPSQKIFQLKNFYDNKSLNLKADSEDVRKELVYAERKRFFADYDTYLDAAEHGPTHLKIPDIAELVAREIHRFDGELYDLKAYCIMSNHVHMLIDTNLQFAAAFEMADWESLHFKPLDYIMKRIKGPSAVYANRVLGLIGEKFWQRESFDHYVRNEKEFWNILNYIINNPVKAGLVEQWEEYPFTFLKMDRLP